MAPKRKRPEAEATADAADTSSAPAPRRSTRSSTTKGSSSGSKAAPAKGVPPKPVSDAASDVTEDTPRLKKSKPAAPKAAATKAAKAKASKVASGEHAGASTTKPARTTKSKAKSKPETNDQADGAAGDEEFPTKSKKATVAPSKSEPTYPPYSATDALALFEKYADADEPDVIGPEGLEKLCTDAEVPMDGALPLILAWQLRTKEMAKITREEWVKGMTELRISSLSVLALALRDLEDLLILDKPPIKRLSTPASSVHKKGAKAAVSMAELDGPYNRERYFDYALRKKEAFVELYQFCFGLAKTEGSRNIDIEMAVPFWSVLVVPKYPIMSDILEFINEKGTFKGVNKDLWQMTLDFCESVSRNLDNYDADGAWPTMLDEFVSWKKSKQGEKERKGQVGGA